MAEIQKLPVFGPDHKTITGVCWVVITDDQVVLQLNTVDEVNSFVKGMTQ